LNAASGSVKSSAAISLGEPAVKGKQLLIGLVFLAILAIGVGAYFVFFNNASESAVPDAGDKATVTLTAYDRTLGSPKAPILMVEYAAPSCPHCAHFDKDIFPAVKRAYIDTGKIHYVFRVFPLGPVDVAAESIARCLPEDNYFQFIDLLFRNQAKWDPEFRVPDVHGGLVAMGRIAGLSEAQVDACIADQAAAQKITQVGTDATTRYSVNGTPTFIINGQIRGAFEDWQEFQAFIDPMLPKK
jgi:protein-disulfide isomerase